MQHVIEKFESIPNLIKARISKAVDQTLFAPYQSKVFYGGQELGIFGHGSLQFARDVIPFGDMKGAAVAVQIGNMCEIASGCSILIGGEHRNGAVINHSFSVMQDLKALAKTRGIKLEGSYSRGAVVIGSNVTFSVNCVVRSGVSIGDGAVIGAGAVVTRDIPPFAIAAGNPARVIKLRFDEAMIENLRKIRWWDMNPDAFLRNLPLIQALPDQEALSRLLALPPTDYRAANSNYLVFTAERRKDNITSLALAGAEAGGKFIKLDDLPDEFRFFVDQVKLPPGSEFYLVKDIFRLCGMG